jgi:hypothetical protein
MLDFVFFIISEKTLYVRYQIQNTKLLTSWSFFVRLFQLRPRGETDITLGFGPSVSGSNPDEGTNKRNIKYG